MIDRFLRDPRKMAAAAVAAAAGLYLLGDAGVIPPWWGGPLLVGIVYGAGALWGWRRRAAEQRAERERSAAWKRTMAAAIAAAQAERAASD